MHLRYLRELAGRYVAALCDVSPRPLAFAAERFPAARTFVNWRDLVVEPA